MVNALEETQNNQMWPVSEIFETCSHTRGHRRTETRRLEGDLLVNEWQAWFKHVCRTQQLSQTESGLNRGIRADLFDRWTLRCILVLWIGTVTSVAVGESMVR